MPVRQGTVSLVLSAYNSMYMAWSCKYMLLLYVCGALLDPDGAS